MSEEDRYSRQSLIPGWNQEKLDNSIVVLVGVGAIGSYVATILASSGIGKLVIIEFDTIELSNLNRQLLFRNEDVGKPKAEIAAQRLRELNPDIIIEFHQGKMEEVPVAVYKEANVIIGCLDTFIGRRWLSSMALNVKKPLILGGMFAFLGDVQVIIPFKTACFECQPLVPDEELAQACTPFGVERQTEREVEEDPKLPAISTLSSIIGGVMAQEALKLILKLGIPLENYMFYDGLNNATTIIPLAQAQDCPACGDMYKLEQIEFVVHQDETIKDFILRLALTYGLEKPDLMIRGKLLEGGSIARDKLKERSIAYILDKNLAKPIKIIIKMEKS
jgi:molybdopterin/thiamine biosynthesis adenylyltransferase